MHEVVDTAGRGSSGVPLVSVCIPTRNHANYIRAAVESVLTQGGGVSIEVLVGVDPSTDGTHDVVDDIVARHPGEVFAFHAPERLGGIRNLMGLVRRARGRFVAHLDGDDMWLPGKLKAQLSLLRSDPALVAVYSNAKLLDAQGRCVGKFSNASIARITLAELVERGNFLNHSSLLYRAELREALLGLPETVLDYGIHIALACVGPLGYLPEPLVMYRVGAPESVIRWNNDGIRERYWLALASIDANRLSGRSRLAMSADFLRRVAFRALRTRDRSLFGRWWRRVRADTGLHAMPLAAATISAILAEAARQLMQAALSPLRGAHSRVLYFR